MSINAWFFYSGKQKRNCYIVAFSWMCKNKYRFSSSQQNWFSKQEKVVILAIKVWFGEKFLGRFNEDRKPTCIETTLLMLPELQVCYRLGRSKKEFISLDTVFYLKWREQHWELTIRLVEKVSGKDHELRWQAKRVDNCGWKKAVQSEGSLWNVYLLILCNASQHSCDLKKEL